MRTVMRAAAWVALCCSAACNSNNQVGTKYAASALVQAATGGNVTVTAADVAGSSATNLAGASIVIPPNALSADTTITIAPGDTTGFSGLVGPVAVYGPSAVSFGHQATVVLPFAVGGGQSVSAIAVRCIDAAGNALTVSNDHLTIDTTGGTVSFTAAGLFTCGPVIGPTACASDETFCGCCGNGRCLPPGEACPEIACPACTVGGGNCCPAGETFCGCGDVGQCLPPGQACALDCPVLDPATTGATPVHPVCCPAGTYLCGCGGEGQCIPDTKACPLLCPVCDPPNTFPSPCGCLPPGAICACDPTNPSTVPCQCDPTAQSSASTLCVVDGGNVCPAAEVLTACGCLPAGAMCVPPPDAGCDPSTATGDLRCCDGQCVGAGQTCPNICFSDGGVSTVDGGVCPAGESRCSNGKCQPASAVCP
jgi:hypothetical protein